MRCRRPLKRMPLLYGFFALLAGRRPAAKVRNDNLVTTMRKPVVLARLISACDYRAILCYNALRCRHLMSFAQGSKGETH